MNRARRQAGLTLIEVLIAVTLLSLLSVGILVAMRVGLGALGKANQKLMDNRRVTGAERILQQQIDGMIPVMALCGSGGSGPAPRMPFFQGEPDEMRFVSGYSLQEGWRGYPRILEYKVIPRDDGAGVRLVVNEILYTGPAGAGRLCLAPDPLGPPVARFLPIQAGPGSFVLADKLAYCRFSFQQPGPGMLPPEWVARWSARAWPSAVRIDMASSAPDPSRLPILALTVPLHVFRSPDIQYVDR